MHKLLTDTTALARPAGSPLSLSMVPLGAIIASGTVPLPRDAVEATTRRKPKTSFVAVNPKALILGADAVAALA